MAELTEYLPGRQAEPFDAARWWRGEISVNAKGDMAPGGRRHATAPFRDHHQVLQEVPPDLTEAAYLRARRGQMRPGADREGTLAAIALREIRESIREAGLQPPQLPGELTWIDELEN
jgi:hypothetical protein